MSVQGLPIAAAADIQPGLATVVDLPEDAQWERFVTQAPGGEFLQTDAWARTKPLQFIFKPLARAVTRVVFGRFAGRSSFQRFIHRFRNG